jgi:nucleotide-binding universal stress UspA family protein
MSTTSPLFRRILVATDEGVAGATAARVGRRIVEREGGNLLLLHVESVHSPLSDVLADTASLRQRSDEVRDGGHPSYYRLEYGNPAENIAVIAAAEDASLIVLAHHHRGLIEGMRHPSVTARMFSRAPVPMLIWPDELDGDVYDDLLSLPNSVVLVPLDGSAEAEQALPLAVEFAKRHGCTILLARVVIPLPLGMAGGGFYVAPETTDIENKEAREYLRGTRRRLAEETGLVVQSLLLGGAAAEEIGRALLGHDGSLIVMTTHGRTGLGKLFFGSVALDMIDQAHVPVIVVPPIAIERAGEAVAPDQVVAKASPATTVMGQATVLA